MQVDVLVRTVYDLVSRDVPKHIIIPMVKSGKIHVNEKTIQEQDLSHPAGPGDVLLIGRPMHKR